MNNNQLPGSTEAPRIVLAEDKNANRLAVASFVCGLVGVITIFFSFILGILGIAFYYDAKRRGSNHSKLEAALILNIICIVAPLALMLLAVSCSCETLMLFAL